MSSLPNGIVVIGGGPVGATLVLALRQKGIKATLLEARSRGAANEDKRALALSYGSRMVLQRLGLWQELEAKATPINTIHISQRGSLGRSKLKAQDHDLPALGYVVAYGDLNAILDDHLHAPGRKDAAASDDTHLIYNAEVTAIMPSESVARVKYQHGGESCSMEAAVAILADGGRSLGDIPGLKRESKHYGHDALVTKVQCELAHGNTAYERFTPMGPIALLPNGARDFSLVWTGAEADIKPLLELGDAEFLQQLHVHFGDRVGKFLGVEKRLSFPLKLSYLNPVTAPHLAVIGNAAQTMHPVAGQGFNVGLRDAWELAGQITASPVADWGNPAMMANYQGSRRTDAKRNLIFTDFLVNIFSNDIAGLSVLRGMGLGLLDIVKPAKNRLISKMSFGSHG